MLYERMNSNGELMETENVLMDERNSYVLCYGNGYGNGYVTVETKQESDRPFKGDTSQAMAKVWRPYLQ